MAAIAQTKAAYSAVATNYDTAATLVNATDFTGDVDSKTFIMSFWMNTTINSGSLTSLIGNVNGNFLVYLIGDAVVVYGANSGAAQNLAISAPAYATGVWNHFIIAVDLSSAYAKVYMNDVDVSASIYHFNSAINFSGSGWVIGSAPFSGCLSEFYFAPDQFIDITIDANRRKFISAGLKPVSLGADGSLPTGTAPIMYLRQNGANILVNSGSGGDFTSSTGTVGDCGSSPSS